MKKLSSYLIINILGESVRIPLSPPSPAEAGYGGQSPPVVREGGPPSNAGNVQQSLYFVGHFYFVCGTTFTSLNLPTANTMLGVLIRSSGCSAGHLVVQIERPFAMVFKHIVADEITKSLEITGTTQQPPGCGAVISLSCSNVKTFGEGVLLLPPDAASEHRRNGNCSFLSLNVLLRQSGQAKEYQY